MSLTSKEEFLKQQNDKEIVHKTAQQVLKDFARFGFDIEFPENLSMAYNDLFRQLALIINDMLEYNTSKLYSVLYTIDLNESAIQKSMEQMDNTPLNEIITHLILERELKKVLTREYFKNNS